MYADPVIARKPLKLEADPDVVAEIGGVSAGRPLVIGYRVTRMRGVAFGDLVVRFAEGTLQPRFVEITPIGGVRVLVDRDLVAFLAEGARVRWRRRLLGYGLAVDLEHPERLVEFLGSLGTHG
jgi:hypothetical protein